MLGDPVAAAFCQPASLPSKQTHVVMLKPQSKSGRRNTCLARTLKHVVGVCAAVDTFVLPCPAVMAVMWDRIGRTVLAGLRRVHRQLACAGCTVADNRPHRVIVP
jgi:hypothetical protein